MLFSPEGEDRFIKAMERLAENAARLADALKVEGWTNPDDKQTVTAGIAEVFAGEMRKTRTMIGDINAGFDSTRWVDE